MTANPLLRNLAIADALLARASHDGLPLPTTTVTVPGYTAGEIAFQWQTRGDVERWVAWLGVELEERRTTSRVNVFANATVDGTPIRLAYSAPTEDAAA